MFYENLCCEEVQLILPLGDDLSGNLTFKVPPNKGRSDDFIISHGEPPFDLSGTDLDGVNTSNLIFSYRLNDLHNLVLLNIDVGAAADDASSVNVQEIVDILNENTSFSGLFTASRKTNHNGSPKEQLVITKKHPAIKSFYAASWSADRILLFNKYSGISEIPDFLYANSNITYKIFPMQYTFSNSAANPTLVTSLASGQLDGPDFYFVRSNSDPVIDGLRTVTRIDETTFYVNVNVTTAGTRGFVCGLEDKDKITAAGFSVDNTKLDWEHLQGRAASFPMVKNTIDGSNRITSSIIYNAGSVPGTIGKKIYYTYTSSNTTPNKIFEIPYALSEDDLVGL